MITAGYSILAVFILTVLVLGIIHYVRRHIAATREQLKHVDRSKLRDLDQDAWAEEERRKDDFGNKS